jgi:Leishmanolysin
MDRMNNPSGDLGRTRTGGRPRSWQFPFLVVLAGSILAACSSKNPVQPNPATALHLVTAPPATFAARTTISPGPVVQLVDAGGDPVRTAGVTVTATLNVGSGTLSGTTSVTSDASGQATFSNLSIAGAVGPKGLLFSSSGLLSAAASGLTLTAGAPGAVTANSTVSQSALTGSDITALPSVRVADLDGNPISGASVTFAITAGGGSSTGGAQTTNTNGVATVGGWTVGPSQGTNTMTATVAGLPVVSFNVTAAPAGVAVALTIQTAPPATVAARTTITPAPVVQLVDVVGTPVSTAGITVNVALTGGGTLNGSPSAITDAAGQATFTGLDIAGLVGTRRLQFSSTGLVGVQSGDILLTPGPASNLVANSALTQSGSTGNSAPTLPSVKATDLDGNGVSGVSILFLLTGGGGNITGATQNTNASGVATVGGWTLGAAAGANTLDASGNGVTLTGAPITFTVNATVAVSQFSITLQNIGPALTSPQQAAFNNAKARWEAAITGDLQDIQVNNLDTQSCGGQLVNQTIDDVLIFTRVAPIDGVGNILAQASPCFLRSGGTGLTLIGIMSFDSADLPNLEANGSLNDVILHEMGHVLGFGTLWEPQGTIWTLNFLTGTSPVGFTGSNAIAAYTGFNGGGTATTVPVEDQGGVGTARSHWKETIFKNELMTGFISGTTRPMSRTTIQSLKDLGYVTNPGVADPFDINTAVLRAGPEPAPVELKNDIANVPISVYDPVTRSVIPPLLRRRP